MKNPQYEALTHYYTRDGDIAVNVLINKNRLLIKPAITTYVKEGRFWINDDDRHHAASTLIQILNDYVAERQIAQKLVNLLEEALGSINQEGSFTVVETNLETNKFIVSFGIVEIEGEHMFRGY